MAWLCGLDRLLAEGLGELAGRRYGLLAHGASLTAELVPAHLALAAAGVPPAALYGPEHGFYGVEQDMVASADERDPWTGVSVRSLYGTDAASLVPAPEAFDALDLLLVDLQDVGTRFYTYAATAVWAAETALAAGCDVWVLDRPNPLGGEVVEGNLRRPGFESFVGAFETPVRHGLTIAELLRLEGVRRAWDAAGLRVWELAGWRPADGWADARAWVATSPNLPTLDIALIYPGGCLVEGTAYSEGRGTTRPFRLVGGPGVDPRALVAALAERLLPGLAFVPVYFRPQFQKHAGSVCGGVEVVVTEAATVEPLRFGCELLMALAKVDADGFDWRHEPYEFVTDRPAIDLLAGCDDLRRAIEARDRDALDAWVAGWGDDEARFRSEVAPLLLYPRETW
ncbi:MAG TPA: DUF1343 domain-containing protein [Thermoanaerobaculia bacterium]|nr:DUF1343 domain-containing protein [Thermoanaerobaculia bacterium]